jgi:hypothetical protein
MNKNRWMELSFIEDVKCLRKYGLKEYYNKANTTLYEFLNPELSYNYDEVNMSDDQKMWKVEKQDDDPQFLITLKNGMGGKFFVLDFYFFEGGFDKQQGLKGKHYLDTLTKIVKDNIIPYFMSSQKTHLYFNAYNGDGDGKTRQNIFSKIIDKFVNKNQFNIENRNEDFIIVKNKN